MSATTLPQEILALERPHRALWTYYVLCALFTGPGVLVALPYLYFRYHTLRYRFDDEGIHMQVGILFREEVNLTYARIQDIHLRSNFIQRWLGLANVQIQTASGSAGAEMVIEGFPQFALIRDFLYTRMRGYQERPHGAPAQSAQAGIHPAGAAPAGNAESDEAIRLLRNIRDELKGTREQLAVNLAVTPAKGLPLPPGADSLSGPTAPANHG
jgi:putative membrane protein